MQAPSLDLVDTEYSACSISVCPSNRSIVACGLYQVVKDESVEQIDESSPATKRLGRCILMQMDDDGKLHELDRVEQSAILDMAWSNDSSTQTLAVANSTGEICLYSLDDGQKLREVQRVEVSDTSRLCLSLDWSNRRDKTSDSLVVSISDGTVAILRGDNDMQVDQSWKAHDYEPWIAAWDYWNLDSVWTGGDDCKLKLWDLRQGTSRPSAMNRSFEAGVTTIQSNPHCEHIFAVGSYDAIVRIFDDRNIAAPVHSHNVGGGVWRVRWHPQKADRLLTACMHDGFKVLDYTSRFTVCSTTTRFDEHGKDALAYGADWAVGTPKSDLVATCSFYDHQLRTWAAAE